uniref:Uncharacterized protein n=1 Tax=Candidatus Kentrum sp. FW TaxID=2126338 RepID=A0A450TUS8_9GAMM|nr:MAG: hypothetical protein BECKFW1821C_GA0114237_103629 [Candidatus Kentron sp. FW]
MNIKPNTIPLTRLFAWFGVITLFAAMLVLAITLRATDPLASFVFLALAVLIGGIGVLRAARGKGKFATIVSLLGTTAVIALLIPRQWGPDLTTGIRIIAGLGFVAVLLWLWLSPSGDRTGRD